MFFRSEKPRAADLHNALFLHLTSHNLLFIFLEELPDSIKGPEVLPYIYTTYFILWCRHQAQNSLCLSAHSLCEVCSKAISTAVRYIDKRKSHI